MRMRVATLNVWALPDPLAPDVGARMRAIGERLASLELDVAAFQEVWTVDARHRLVAAGEQAGLVHAWHAKPSFGGGLLVLLERIANGGAVDARADAVAGHQFGQLALKAGDIGPDDHVYVSGYDLAYPHATEVAAAVRVLSTSEDRQAVRRAICQIALQLTGADSALLLDLVDDDMRLMVTASAGVPWTVSDFLVADASSSAARAFTAGKPVLLAEPDHDDHAFTLWQPFAAGGRSSVAVLALAWHVPPTLASDRLANLLDLVASEATGVLERADLLTELAELARTDELTGLPNRRAINDDLAREMDRARRESTSLCVGLLDLDHFKDFNDTNGHPAGDRLLAEAASIWRQTLRSGSDLLARYGGEEFLLVLPAPLAEAFATVERLRASTPEGQTVSAGLAHWNGRESAELLVSRADVALYAAKAGGRDRTERAAPEMLHPTRAHRRAR